ncbi:MAG TPA: hypothetical protein VFD84_10490 [Candidatus Binatia bacterium]|jgi:predicted phage gp36 major capsid-like protein|nr:hypothetical protein [Candidatus Binatia bacterium]
MEHLMLASTAADLLAVAALGWLVIRASRARTESLDDQRATLEALRGDLSQLVADAEERAQALDEALAAREKRLRALLHDLGRLEPGRDGARAGRARDERAPEPAGARAAERGAERAAPRLDPAEARLLRDLEVRFAARGRRA